jgi:uncharacterized protein YktA (UPF0223 family)
MPKLPKILFSKVVVDRDCTYFESSTDEKKLWEDMEKWTTVGEYKLVRTIKVKGDVIVKGK